MSELSYAPDIDYLQNRDEWVEKWPAGRRCAHPGCSTILSIYNAEAYCAAHVQGHTTMHYQGMDFGVCDHCKIVYEARNFLGGKGHKDTVCRSCRNKEELERLQGVAAITHKTCPGCGESKPRTAHFWVMRKDRHGDDTPHGRCRDCKNSRFRERYQARTTKGNA